MRKELIQYVLLTDGNVPDYNWVWHHTQNDYKNYIRNIGPPLWSSGQSSWLQTQRTGFDSRRYDIFWKVVGLERGPLSLASTVEELLGRKSRNPRLRLQEIRRAEYATPLYPQTFALTSSTWGGRSVGKVLSRTQVTEFSLFVRNPVTLIGTIKLWECANGANFPKIIFVQHIQWA
jgi:hypothetical protein